MLSRRLLTGCLLSAILLFGGRVGADQSVPQTATPKTVAEARELQKRVQEVTRRVTPAVVGLEIGGASGSGVIVSEDGYVLTAGHVSGKPNAKATVIMPDGTRLEGKTLGSNKGIDSGMVKITPEGKYPFVPMGDSTKLKKGQWCIALGHPGGFSKERTPVLRLGRVLDNQKGQIQTDCTLVGGDSGGPLFDLDGKVIGIHSRIGQAIVYNIHVPVATFATTWKYLAAGETWENRSGLGPPPPPPAAAPTLPGLVLEKIGDRMKIAGVDKDSAAEKAGFKPKDYFAQVDGQDVSNRDEIDAILRKKKPGDEVVVEVVRGAERLKLKLALGKAKT